ncbi:MAG: Uncharacterised protein [Puniceicoccaceae bacterium MED-G32]|nr:MAG: Uncharacterised protein [Puniceicoccaceae bacterium MED-G32]
MLLNMVSPTNLTDHISQLRENKQASSVLNSRENTPTPPKKKAPAPKEAAFDAFMTISYTLFLIALVGQLFLIISLDIF